MLKPEAQLQKAVCQYLTLNRIPFHCDFSGQKRSRYEQYEAKAMGLKPGWPDVQICMMKQGYGGMFLELKVKGGRVRDTQKETMEMLREQGYKCEVAWNLDEAINLINEYLK